MKILISIKPQFANLIFEGIKKYEFRKSIPKNKNVKKAVVYASSPVKKAIGEFTIDEILCYDLETLWTETHKYSGITKEYFLEYFKGKSEGYALKITSFVKYTSPICIKETYNSHPPQSFRYLM